LIRCRLRFTVELKQRCRVQAAGRAKYRLRLAHQRRHLEQCAGGDARAAYERRKTALQRFDAGFAANAATRRDVEIALKALAKSSGRHVEDQVKCIRLWSPSRIPRTANLG